jgi:CheY-like chemotaxis protein
MKILVVEDEPVEMKLAVHVLSAAGHEVLRAEAAEHALDAVRAALPDVILLDLSLPGMDGLALARSLKADPETCDIPIVAVTSNPEKFTRSAAMAAGCEAYLRKPVSTRLLPKVLSEVVDLADGPAQP